jgi:eukaryotic-like serine/threonine-protein kinase
MGDDLDRLKAAVADRYVIEREIGAGGMATVYLARDLRHDRPVALKVLDADLTSGIGPERFLREIRTTANLSHPHILPLFDSGVAGEILWYVMPYVAGESLRARLTRENQLPVDDAVRITREIADALSYAHAHGVVHRDVKPENILLEAGHAVIADFGIARATEPAVRPGAVDGLTGTGVVVGTPAYMSPEQAAGGKELDGRSDLYSLGCVLYEMLAGHPPFTGPSAESVVYQHLSAEPPRITGIRPGVPAGVAMALERALAKTAADRFHPAARFAEALGHVDSGATPTSPPRDGIAPRGRRRASFRSAWKMAGVAVVGVAALLGAGVVLGWWPVASTGAARDGGHPRTAVAVLPFQNLSGDGPYGYFAAGLHDELLTQLSKVAALSLRGRTSVMGYAGTTKSIRQIADELNVGVLVEGSVQVVGGRLRVNVQLIDALTDEHMWAESYDRTLDDAFAIQRDIAQQIVAAMDAALGSSERKALAEVPTNSPEAYRLYLQGREYFRRPGFQHQNVEVAIRLYERAIALDPEFALAHAALSDAHGRMHWWRVDPSPERVALQREAAETALRLAPDLPQSHLAMGQLYFMAYLDFRRALNAFAVALEGLPNDGEVVYWIGSTHRRLGNWDEVLAAYEKATELDPRDANLHFETGGRTLRFLRRYADAIQAFDRALELAPDLHDVVMSRAWTFVEWQGQLDSVRRALERVPAEQFLENRISLLYWQRDADALLELLKTVPFTVFEERGQFVPASIYAARAYRMRGDEQLARAAFHDALSILDSVMVVLPDDWRVHATRGLALAGLGRNDEAVREARWLEQSFVYCEDVFDRLWRLAPARAQILAHAGKVDAALDEIERLLAGPSGLSVNGLRLNPVWDPIRDHPRFKSLVAKYSGM